MPANVRSTLRDKPYVGRKSAVRSLPHIDIPELRSGNSISVAKTVANIRKRRRRRDLLVAPPGDDESFVVEPKAPVPLQHALGGLQVRPGSDDGVEPLVLNLVDVNRGIPGGK